MKNIKHINSEITENYKNYTSHPIVANKIEEFIQEVLNKFQFFRKFNLRKKCVFKFWFCSCRLLFGRE